MSNKMISAFNKIKSACDKASSCSSHLAALLRSAAGCIYWMYKYWCVCVWAHEWIAHVLSLQSPHYTVGGSYRKCIACPHRIDLSSSFWSSFTLHTASHSNPVQHITMTQCAFLCFKCFYLHVLMCHLKLTDWAVLIQIINPDNYSLTLMSWLFSKNTLVFRKINVFTCLTVSLTVHKGLWNRAKTEWVCPSSLKMCILLYTFLCNV